MLDQHYQHQLSKPLPSPWCYKGWFLCFTFRYQEPKHQRRTSFIAWDNNRVCAPNNGFFDMVFSFAKGTSDNHDCWIRLYCMMNTAQICFCRIKRCAVELPCSFCHQFTPRHLRLVCLNICWVQHYNLVFPNFIAIFSFVVSHKLRQTKVLKPSAEHL